MATSSIDYNPTLIYHEGDYCKWPTDGTVDGYLWRCKATTTGVFDEECWIQLGLVIDQTGYLKSDEGDISYADEVYMKEEGGIFDGEVSYNITGATSEARKPFRFLQGSSTNGDMCIFQGGYGTTLLSSGNLVANTSIFSDDKFNITPESRDLDVISYGEVNVFTNALSTQAAIKALSIDKTGKLLVKAKDSAVVNSKVELATEAQVYNAKTELNNKITTNDSKVVHLGGAEEKITSTKTFNAAPKLRDNLAPSTNTAKTNSIEDILLQTSLNTNGLVDGASIIRNQKTDGSREVRYRAGFRRIPESTEEGVNNNLWPAVCVGVSSSNTTYGRFDTNLAYAPNPENTTSTSDQRIVTVGWANSPNSNNIVHKTGDETIDGNKTFNKSIKIMNSDQNSGLIIEGTPSVSEGSYGKITFKNGSTSSCSIYVSRTKHSSIIGSPKYTEDMTFSGTPLLYTSPSDRNIIQSNAIVDYKFVSNYISSVFGKSKPKRMVNILNSGPIGSGNISLTSDFTNYNMLLFQITTDNQAQGTTILIPSWELDWRLQQSGWTQGVYMAGFQGAYWYIKTYNAGTTKTNLVVYTENSVIQAIYGIDFTPFNS